MVSGAHATPRDDSGAVPASAYRAALDATASVIQRRARNFRNLVVVVALIGVASVAGTLLVRSPLGLVGLLLLVPACGVFFVADAELLSGWRSTLLAGWVRRDVNLAAFRAALRANPALPGETMEAMLTTLPSAGDLTAEQRILTPTRQAVVAAARMVYRGRVDALLLDAIVSAIAAGAVASALSTRSWFPLLGLSALAPRPLVGAALRRRRRAERDDVVGASRGEAGFDEEAYTRLLATLR